MQFASNALFNASGTRGDPSAFGNYSQAASLMQTVGDAISVGIGIVEIAGSMTGVLGDAVATPFTGGATTLAIAPTLAVTVHESGMTLSAIKNLLNQTKVEAKENRRVTDEHRRGRRESTRQDHEEAQSRKNKEQNQADERYRQTKSRKEEKTNNQKKEEDPEYYRKGPKQARS